MSGVTGRGMRCCGQRAWPAGRSLRRRLASVATEAIRARRRASGSWRRLEPNRHGSDNNLAARVSELGVPMSQKEMEALAMATRSQRSRDGGSRREFRKMVRSRVEAEAERQALAEIILRADEQTLAQRALRTFDYVGTALFAMSGTLIAGETGMHVVGATLVGCAASMGGGTINNIIMGTTAGGVYWIRDVSYLLVAACASVLTFYSWPYVELELARREMNFNEILPNDSSTVTLLQFKIALEKNPAFEQRVRRAIAEELFDGSDLADAEPEDIFAWLDFEGTGELNRDELLVLARRQADESFLVFAVESVALGAFAVHTFAASSSKFRDAKLKCWTNATQVSGAQSAVVRGLHPVACTAAGVVIVSGGIFRDILCRRESVALSVESFALATGFGSATYVYLRYLLVKYGLPLPLGFRILCAASVTVAFRAAHWVRKPDTLLAPMANYRDKSARRRHIAHADAQGIRQVSCLEVNERPLVDESDRGNTPDS